MTVLYTTTLRYYRNIAQPDITQGLYWYGTSKTTWSYAWWPTVEKDIYKLVKSCNSCQQAQKPPESTVFHPRIWPSKP